MNFSPLFCGFFRSRGSAWAQIRVFVKCFAVLVQKLDSDLGPDESFLDLLLYELFHSPLQVVGKILNDCEDLLDGGSLDYFLDEIVVRFIRVGIHMNFGDTPKKVM